MESFNLIVDALSRANADIDKAKEGNASAKKRVRKEMLDIHKLSKQVRAEIQEL
jgi:Histone H1-like protein Hc1